VINVFYRNLHLLVIAIALIVVWGTSSFFSLPRLEDPELTQRYALITTQFPGASAERVEALVTQKLEKELFEIEEIDVVESTSRQGFSSVTVQLKGEVTEVDEVWSRVRDQVSNARLLLPPDASEPTFDKSEVTANALIVALTWDLPPPTHYGILRRLGEELEDQMRLIQGTENTRLYGAPAEEIVVEIRPDSLTALGLTVTDLSQQISNSDAKVSAGQLHDANHQLLFEINGELDSLDRIRNIPIQSGDRAQFTRLGDIAQVEKGVVNPPSELAVIEGKPAVAIAAVVASNQSLSQWNSTANRVIDRFKARLPQGVGLHTVFSQNQYVQSRLNQVISNLFLGAVLVAAVTFLLMGWKSALIISSALPLAILIVFGCMNVWGIPLHQVSVTGIIIALGLLIDNAIIVVDEVQSHLNRGLAPHQAITHTIRHISLPLVASTLTTVLAFLPIAISKGETGEFTSTIGTTVILSIVSSLVLSLTLIPALVGRLHRWRQTPVVGTWWQTGFSSPRLTQIYRWTIDRALARPMLGIGLALILPINGFLLFPTLEQQFFAPADRQQCYIEFELPAQAALEQTQETVIRARELIQRHAEVTDVQWFVGRSAPKFYYNVVSERESSANYAQGIVQLHDQVQSAQLIQVLQQELDQAFPAAQIVVRQLEQGPPFAAPIELRLYGADLAQLQELGNQLRSELIQIPDVIHTRVALTDASPKLSLNLDEEQARLVGVDKTAIAQQLNANLEGAVGGSVLEMTENLPVRVRLPNSQRSQLAQIASLNLLPSQANGSPIPLTALGDIELVPTIATIPRRNGQRVNIVQGFITAGILPAQVLSAFQQHLQSIGFELPPGYSFEFGGEADERNTAISNLVATLGVLFLFMAATLVLTFGSFRMAGVILLIAVLSVGLGLISLRIFNYPFGFTAILGTIGLIGVAINDSIVMLSALHENPDVRKGDRRLAAEIVVHSTRHIIATTVTTVLGFLPLMFDRSGFWPPPLAITFIGGLVGATAIALYFVPCVYWLIRPQQFSK